MRCAPHVLLCFFASLWNAFDLGNAAKSSPNPELLTTFAKNVATVLSPALLSELQGNRINRSAVNLGRTVSEKRNEELVASPTSDNAVNENIPPQVHYLNQIYPYHYERRYQYTYPPYTVHDGGFYNPYISPVSPESSEFYQSRIYGPHNLPPPHFGPNNDVEKMSGGNMPENSPDSERNAGSVLEANVPVHRHFDSPHLSTFTSPFSKFSVGDFHRVRHSLIPSPFLARGYGYFGPAGCDPHVPYHHPPFYVPPQNPVMPPDQSSMPGNGETENNSSSTNQETRQPGQPTYGSPIVSSFHLQGYPSSSFNLLPYHRFNNVFNGNTTNVPYYSPPFHGFRPGYNLYLPPSSSSGSSTPAPVDMSKKENPDAENIEPPADTAKSPETIETSGSNRYESKIPFSLTAFNERQKTLENFFYPYRI